MATAGFQMSQLQPTSDPTLAACRVFGEIPTQIPALVDCIELELRKIGLWERHRPPEDVFSSKLPFKLDTMNIAQWLQWVFVPQMRGILRNRKPLPISCDIHSFASARLTGQGDSVRRLLTFISRLDSLITERGRLLH
jgi:uncharacterized protein YqcC (DUF446 family)